MLLTASVTKRLDVPGSDGQWVEIRKLGWRKLRDASDVMSRQAYEAVRVLGKEGLAAVQDVTADQISAYRSNAAAAFDPGVLLRSAVVAWSLTDKSPTPDELDGLPEDVATWLVGEIVTLARPPRDEAAAKND